MFRNRSVRVDHFAMVPRADVPRSAFNIEFTHKTTFDSDYLIPIFCEEVLPGDSWRVELTAFARLSTPIFPLMDNLHLDTFFFFVPNRIIWNNFKRMMGEQNYPGESTDFLVPTITSPAGGYPVGSVYDYFGLPTVGQVTADKTVTHSALPLRAYNRIFNNWFRDENIGNAPINEQGDGPEPSTNYALRTRAKRPDYFTTALPWPQKGESVTIPIGDQAPVRTYAVPHTTGVAQAIRFRTTAGGTPNIAQIGVNTNDAVNGGGRALQGTTTAGTYSAGQELYPSNLYADLSESVAATINSLRQAFQIQKLLERDARGGTRYTELVQSHFGVQSPDARLQRAEYLGGGSTPMTVTPVAQSSASSIQGSDTPLGNLAGVGTVVGRHGFSGSFVEHGYVIGLANVRGDITYQQGLRRHWSRRTKFDFYFPAFAHLGEQAILSKELYCTGDTADEDVFGYQERWGELRYIPSQITGLFRSTSAGTLDAWHLAQRFFTRPVLNNSWVLAQTPLQRVLAVGAAAGGAQIIFDSLFKCRVARPIPMYSVPGLLDHF